MSETEYLETKALLARIYMGREHTRQYKQAIANLERQRTKRSKSRAD